MNMAQTLCKKSIYGNRVEQNTYISDNESLDLEMFSILNLRIMTQRVDVDFQADFLQDKAV